MAGRKVFKNEANGLVRGFLRGNQQPRVRNQEKKNPLLNVTSLTDSILRIAISTYIEMLALNKNERNEIHQNFNINHS